MNGFLALIIGVLLLSLPFLTAAITMAILIGFYGILGGITLILLAFVSKSAQGQSQHKAWDNGDQKLISGRVSKK